MFAAIRRAWKGYLDSIPAPDEPEYLPDSKIIKEEFSHPPITELVRNDFCALAKLLTTHLPETQAILQQKRLNSRLKPGIEPCEALGRWILGNATPKAPPVGVIACDWKAREEVNWQASKLAIAHGLKLDWRYDSESDTEWQGWQGRNEFPVDTPLKSLGSALAKHEITLLRVPIDDSVVAFAVKSSDSNAVRALCKRLNIDLAHEI